MSQQIPITRLVLVLMTLSMLLPDHLSAKSSAAVPDSMILFDFNHDSELPEFITKDAEVSLVGESGDRQLRVKTGLNQAGPGVILKKTHGSWNLDPYYHVKIDITNVGEYPAEVIFKVGDPEDGMESWQMEIRFDLLPGQTKTVADDISTTPWRFYESLELRGMRAAPGQAKTDLTAIDQVKVSIMSATHAHELLIDNIRATNPVRWVRSEGFLPFINRFGQYKHADWTGKTLSVDDMQQHAADEARALLSKPGPAHFSKFGGWKDGPRLKATGYFRTAKHDGVWWLVDPEGYLFWSHGVCCVSLYAGATGITDREDYFEWLPPKEEVPYNEFYGTGHGASHGYYKGKGARDTFHFTAANVYRKYGDNWHEAFKDVTHKRLRSWGMNTLAIASDDDLCQDGRTPYTETVWLGRTRVIEGSKGYWGKFRDVFDPAFREAVARALEGREASNNDPWCIGYFIENELSWGVDGSLSLAALRSPSDQPAKRVFIDDLKKKYRRIDALNAQWGTEYNTWEALLQSTDTPDEMKAWDDLITFYEKIAETYFSTVHNEMKAVAPNIMYLGCRLAWSMSDVVVRTAAKYSEVLSMNKYKYNVTNVGLPEGIDKPIVISEFHFGALDRGSLHVGVRSASNQSERSEFYQNYLQSALLNPYIVGTHWFQYFDQPPTGRSDGENYNVGLVDLTDQPFPELVQKVTEVGHSMYPFRSDSALNGEIVQPKKSSKSKAIREDTDMHKRSN
ncbi:MAG: beta-agarase [Coraliomargaritaceae bacterium]